MCLIMVNTNPRRAKPRFAGKVMKQMYFFDPSKAVLYSLIIKSIMFPARKYANAKLLLVHKIDILVNINSNI